MRGLDDPQVQPCVLILSVTVTVTKPAVEMVDRPTNHQRKPTRNVSGSELQTRLHESKIRTLKEDSDLIVVHGAQLQSFVRDTSVNPRAEKKKVKKKLGGLGGGLGVRNGER